MTVAEKATGRLTREPAIGESSGDSSRGGDGWAMAGMIATPIRWVTGWLFFSAF